MSDSDKPDGLKPIQEISFLFEDSPSTNVRARVKELVETMKEIDFVLSTLSSYSEKCSKKN